MTKLIDYEIPQDILRIGHCQMRVGSELVIDFYLRILSEGTPPKMAESLAMQQAPGIGVTNAIFVQDQNRHGRMILDRMNGDPRQVEALKKSLARNGYRLRAGDHYIPTAARFAGDPEAIVNNTNTFSDLKKKVESRGRETHGAVSVNHDAERHRVKSVRLSNKIVQRIDQHQIKQDPSLARTAVSDRHAAIIEKHGASKKDD